MVRTAAAFSIANATAPASFKYDSAGRRVSRTVGSTTTAFNYDGDNFIQELDAVGRSSNIRANLLTGGIDQHFMRQTMVAGAPSLSWAMAEANSSTVVLTDGQGNVQKTFQYTPYGSQVATTGNSTDSQRYTGREDDGTGLYYYRARYYRPDCMRFISEDPIGWASGQANNYAYVGGDPIGFRDPSGLSGCGFLDGVASYFEGIGSLFAHLGRRSGFSGEEAQNRAILDEAVLGAAILGYATVPQFRERANPKIVDFAKAHPSYLVGRAGTAVTGYVVGTLFAGGCWICCCWICKYGINFRVGHRSGS